MIFHFKFHFSVIEMSRALVGFMGLFRCNLMSVLLFPVQLYATGYGAGGRLGIGGTESVSTPTLLESIQHVLIRKVAVNSGGKHCLALSSEGEVYSWGEAEDGKLGHGNRRYDDSMYFPCWFVNFVLYSVLALSVSEQHLQ